MSEPMPVTTRIISAESWSIRSANGTRRAPDVSQLKTTCSAACPPSPKSGQAETTDDEERPEHRQTGEAAGDGLRQPAPEEGVDEKAREGQERNQEQHVTT